MRKSGRLSAALCFALIPLATSFAQSRSAQDREARIQAILQSQVEAWNRHDLDAFMAGYWNAPTLTFFSGASETEGWQATLERYRKNYQSANAEMGKLEFSDLRIEMLGPQSAFVRGKFRLTFSKGKQPTVCLR
jgi:beta-aspartyl-peptidase (threonine type)